VFLSFQLLKCSKQSATKESNYVVFDFVFRLAFKMKNCLKMAMHIVSMFICVSSVITSECSV
jgi:hypothetical protein